MTRRGTRRTAPTSLTTLVLCLCGTVAALLQTIIVPVLGKLPLLLHTSSANVSWLVTATLLASTVTTPVAGRLADSYTKRRILLACLTSMTAGSLLGAVSGELALVIAARALQGTGLALIPVGIAALRDELPADRVPFGISVMSATISIGAGVGLPLGGWIAEHLDWHWLFWVPAGSGLVMFCAVAVVLPPRRGGSGGRFDVIGALGLAGALTALLLALSRGDLWGWTSGSTLGCAAGGVLLLAGWVPWELRVRRPLVDLRLAVHPALAVVNVAAAFAGLGMFANLLVTTQVLQLPTATGFGLGRGTLAAGVLMAPASLMMLFVAPFTAIGIRRFGAHVTLAAGAGLMATAYSVRCLTDSNLHNLIVSMLVVALGTALVYGAMPALVLRVAPPAQAASANSVNTLMRAFGTASTSAALAAATTARHQRIDGVSYPTQGALTLVFWLAAASCGLAALLMAPLIVRRTLLATYVANDDHPSTAPPPTRSRAQEPLAAER
ncbi:MFS transporter [uncultured Jatrophihabitans sp.]|uniref:MFS transporter n=1 Tax=uncultured Jatrophihabitans sp. TaxID=1610747 RepID=UPI0035CA3863